MMFVYVVSMQRTFLSPLIMVLLFAIGFLLKLAVNIYNYTELETSGWMAIGNFGFSFKEFLELYIIVIVGFSGILFGLVSFKYFVSSKVKCVIIKKQNRISNAYFKKLIIGWFVAFLALILLMKYLGIGIHGFATEEEQRLPFKLVGIMLYFRGMFFPAMGVILLDIAHTKREKNIFYLILALIVGLTGLIAVFSLSRSSVFIPSMIVVLYMVANRNEFGLKARHLLCGSVIFLVLLSGAVIIEVFRGMIYQEGQDIYDVTLFFNVLSSIDLSAPFSFMASMLTSRIEGSRELMAVMSSSLAGIYTFFQVFFNTGDVNIPINVYNINIQTLGRAYGMTIGMLGLLYVSKNLLLVFIGTIFMTYLFLLVEYIFSVRGFRIAGFYLSCVWIIIIWMNITSFFFFRYFMITLLLLFTVNFLNNRFVFKAVQRPYSYLSSRHNNLGPL
ncbi:MAG: hypothetical protein PHU49_01815 [Syntrophorhabdaceae bacterium]|nr:hypothetical protein [Syntrophorhabdaceae bacterium]